MELIPDRYISDFDKSLLLSHGVFYSIGASIANIQKLDTTDNTFKSKSDDYIIELLKSETALKDLIRYAGTDLYSSVRSQIDKNYYTNKPALCHGDLHRKNIFYDGKIEITDIDPNPKIYDRLLDLAHFLSVYIPSKSRSGIQEQVIKGYASVLELNLSKLNSAYVITISKRCLEYKRKSQDNKLKSALDLLAQQHDQGWCLDMHRKSRLY